LPSDFLVCAFNNGGVKQWENKFGGTGIDRAYSIQATSDGGYIMAGFTTSNDGSVTGNHSPGVADVWLLKLDGARNIQWQKCFGGAGADTAYAVLETPDNGFIVAGVSSSSGGDLTGNNGLSDAWVFRTDNAGNLIWQKNIGGVMHEAFKGIVFNSDSSYTLTGYTSSPSVTDNPWKGGADLWLHRVDGSTGNPIWSKGYGGTADEQGYSVTRTVGNGYLVAGFTESMNGDVTSQAGRSDAWLLNLTSDGSLIWQKTTGTNKDEYAMSGHFLSASEFMLTGFASPPVASLFDSADGYVVRLGNVNTIKGTVYFDANLNGVKDSGEEPFEEAVVTAAKAGYQRRAVPFNGEFSIDVETGSYTTSVTTPYPYYTSVPSSHVTNFPGYFATDSFSFAIQPTPGITDLSLRAIALGPARPGFNVTYKLYYKNVGTVSIPNASVRFKPDSRLNLVSATPAANATSVDTLIWTLSNVAPLDSGSISLSFTVSPPPAANNGDTLKSIGIILPVVGDQTPSDDTTVVRQVVVGSYDPNDKAENVAGAITKQDVDAGIYINYVIRFQNTGTDTAFNILVRDTLDARLDWNSMQMIGSSHPYQLNISNGNNLQWSFPDIMLVDSFQNEPASHGFIAYRIKPLTSLSAGDIISNGASIYFDFNLPVQTNVALTYVQASIVLPLNLLQFDGVYNNDKTRLYWSSVNEQDFLKFEVERSLDGSNFAFIGVKYANANAGVRNYEFVDDLTNMAGSIFYYRLKMVDTDGKIRYSKMILIRRGRLDIQTVFYPNPVTGHQAQLLIVSQTEGMARLQIIDPTGRIVLRQQAMLYPGNNSISVNGIDRLIHGSYLLNVISGDQTSALKFMVVR
jgi:uncharacterized repeat protein (TIGR01451 family)